MKFSISIVSHNSGSLIANLLDDLRRFLPAESEIILTLNCPEDEGFLERSADLGITILRNVRPLGFGANHNQAFAMSRGRAFVVVNPDIRLPKPPWQALAEAMTADVGACAPMVVSPTGSPEDSVRRYPTMSRLFRRAVLKQRSPDYVAAGADSRPVSVEWTAGMFMMFDADAYRAVQGFDTRYFMYLEDVDICKRLNAKGLRVLWVPGCSVIHDARRASQRSWQHARWHLRGVLRFLTGF
jgi:GT2 family glycosyltransferase